jgi:AcrR family transcriptional regulator
VYQFFFMRRTTSETPVTDAGALRPGRPRSPVAHQAILSATIALIRDVGYDAVTMEGVAELAGVGKATLYRRWSGKELLVADAIEQIASAIANPDTGTLRGDVLAVMRSSATMYRDPASGALLSGLVAAIARSAPIAAAVRDGFVAARRNALRLVLERWRERGELRPDLDVEILMDMITGPLFYRFLLRGETVDESVVEAILDTLLRGIVAHGPENSTQGGTA